LASLALSVTLGLTPAIAEAQQRPKPDRAEKADRADKADKGDRSEAARLKKDADALMDQDRYVDALALYQRAYDLTSDPALLYNQGRALEAMGEYPDALDKLEKFEHDAPAGLRAKVPGLRDLITDLKSRIATVVVTTNVPGARVTLRDKNAGTIQKELKLRTRAGSASLEVSAEGYVTFKKDLDLAAGSTAKVDAQLSLRKTDAIILVRSQPSADILLDGKALGRSPLEYRATAGSHMLVAQATGYETEKVPMTLALGDKRELDIELHKPPSVFARWWFWTAVGVVAAGAAATVIALQIEKKPTPSNFGGSATVPAP
jgi:tetratricopeptide (TPR) repeat protein